ncbi:ATP-binding protein [Bacillota bacterium]
MLYRKMYANLSSWKNHKSRKALLVTGARQIGKTFLIREFGRHNYENYVEINFITEPKAAAIFDGNLNAETLITNLTAYIMAPLIPGKTLVFLDEIQECPQARTAIKFLAEDGRFDYIESGSLLGVNYKEVKSYPVGYEEILRMYPMDFEEFSMANGVQKSTLTYLKECYEKGEPVREAIHITMSDLFRHYVITGGMPAVVQEFIDTRDIGRVLNMQKDILELYRQDIAKYARYGKERIKDIFDSIPSQLNSQNRRFTLASITKTARMARYSSSFLWLSDAGVALPCFNIQEPKIPLRLSEKRNLFKLYMSDIGLLCAAGLENVQFDILNGDLSVNMGSILENAFAQNLKSNGFDLHYLNKKSLGEIDFILQRGKEILAVEIKSGNDYTKHPALDKASSIQGWNMGNNYVFCKGNLEKKDRITYLPWYMIMHFHQEQLPEHLTVSLDLSGV